MRIAKEHHDMVLEVDSIQLLLRVYIVSAPYRNGIGDPYQDNVVE